MKHLKLLSKILFLLAGLQAACVFSLSALPPCLTYHKTGALYIGPHLKPILNQAINITGFRGIDFGTLKFTVESKYVEVETPAVMFNFCNDATSVPIWNKVKLGSVYTLAMRLPHPAGENRHYHTGIAMQKVRQLSPAKIMSDDGTETIGYGFTDSSSPKDYNETNPATEDYISLLPSVVGAVLQLQKDIEENAALLSELQSSINK